MIKRLRYKFIFIATAALLVVQLYVTGITSIIAQAHTISSVGRLMNILIENSGRMPEMKGESDSRDNGFGIETPYETRYFSVEVGKDGRIEIADITHIAAIEEEEALNLGALALSRGNRRGLFDTGENMYYYSVVKPGEKRLRAAKSISNLVMFPVRVDASKSVKLSDIEGDQQVIFLDCTQRLELVKTIQRLSFMIGGMSFCMFFAIIWIFSKRAIQPVVRNMEAQEQFITNAGHELKTPLTIISANTEVIEMTNGSSEWTESTKNQVKRLTELVNSLIALAKMQENKKPELQEIDLSAIVEETAESFRPVIENQGKSLEISVEKRIRIMGNADMCREMLSILLDNAAKYCDEKGEVIVKAFITGKNALLQVENTYREGKGQDFSKFFERFYRGDVSHNSQKKGYGIGLSIAGRIAQAINGSVKASYEGENIIFGVTLPLKK